jgi:regulator of RNase E activity RraA
MSDATPEVAATALAGRLVNAGTAGLSTALRRRGYHDVFIDGVRPLAVGMRLAGPARTLRFVPFRPDLFEARGGGFNPQKQVFDSVGAGEVIVIEARGQADAGTLGDILAARALYRGAAGVVSDGAVRDMAAVIASGLAVFARGGHPSVLGRRHVPWETDVVIACGGAAIVPGDVVVGDDDGVLVVPADLVGEVLVEAEDTARKDNWIAARVAEGESIDGLFPMNAEWQSRHDAEG